MIVCLLTFGLLALFALSLYGWGTAFRRTFRIPDGGWQATIALGVAAVVFLGGILNLLRLARPWALTVVLAGGILLSVPRLKRMSFERGAHSALVFVLAGVILAFTIVTQLPPSVYNYHDDYQKYFGHAVRMLETGTVYGSPLNAIGSQTLGGQAVLQAFVVAYFPIAYINGLDAVFGLFLCLMLAGEFPGRGRGQWIATILCMLAVIVIDPQVVNSSALYVGSALVLAFAAMASDPRELRGTSAPAPAAVGLVGAALIALKTTFAVFPAMAVLYLVFVLGVRWGIRTGLFLTAFLLPWVLLHSPHYAAWIFGTPGNPLTAPAGPHAVVRLDIFSFKELDYGATVGSYTILLAAIGCCAAIAVWTARRRTDDERATSRVMALIFAAGITTYFLLLLLGPVQSGYVHALRYLAPLAIGLAPAAFGFAARIIGSATPPWRLRILVLPLAAVVVSLAVFAPSFEDRVQQALRSGSGLAFTWLAEDRDYVAYSRQVLYGNTRERVASAQRVIPAGEPVIAWLDTPFYLDYTRNQIFDVDPGGLTTGWAVTPAARYLVWEYDSPATEKENELIDHMRQEGALDRLTAQRTLHFLRRVKAWVAKGQVLYDDGARKVVRLGEPVP